MASSDFDLRAVFHAIEAKRRARDLTWAAVAREVNRNRTFMRPIAASTITGLRTKVAGEGDGILQMLLWLGRTPESFVPGVPDAEAEHFRLAAVDPGQILRWNTRALHRALNDERLARGLTWLQVADRIGGRTPNMLTRMAGGGRTGFPHVMRYVRWLGRPATTFTRVAKW